jgi:hypothetical protein
MPVLQFAANGYQLEGGPLLMTGDAPGGTPTQSFVTVDGGLSADIGSDIGGNAGIGLRKLGAGTLVLSGANTCYYRLFNYGTLVDNGATVISSLCGGAKRTFLSER